MNTSVCAGLLLSALLFPGSILAAREPLTPQEKLKAGDPSRVVTWSASLPAAGGAGKEGQAGVAAAPAASHLEFVAFDAPCKFLDTRVAGGAFARNESRDLSVLDASLPTGLGPCGVPARARAVEVQLNALKGTTTAAGSARLGKGGVAAPAMALQFQKGAGSAGKATVALSAESQIRLTSAGAGAAYVGHLLGYYQAPLWGRVGDDGTLLAGDGVDHIEKSTWYAGDYFIYFDRSVWPGCAIAVTPEWSNIRTFTSPGIGYYYVDARAYDSYAEADGGFSFVIQCR